MTRNLIRVLVVSTVGILCSSAIFGQDARVAAAAGDKYVISAKAGGVNYIEGSVAVTRKVGRGGQLLKGDEIGVGDVVATGENGRAEILLNPGSYLRVDKNTEFSFVSTSLDDLKLKLTSGSAIFEVIAADEFKVSVRAPKADLDLTRSGVYRVDILHDGSAKISVWKGTAFAGSTKAEVKAGREATIGSGSAVVAKFDRDQKDALDTWSKDRAKELSKLNAGLERRTLRNSLLNTFGRRGGWNLYNSFGLWVFNPVRGYWCFMPFGYGWSSPYGYGYDWDVWGVRLPYWIYNQPPPASGGTPHPPTGGGTPPAGPVGHNPNVTETRREIRPPFQQIEQGEGRRGVVDRGSISRGRDSVFTQPDLPSIPAAPPASAPVFIPVPVNPTTESRGKP